MRGILSRYSIEDFERNEVKRETEIADMYRHRCVKLEKEIETLKKKNSFLTKEIVKANRELNDLKDAYIRLLSSNNMDDGK